MNISSQSHRDFSPQQSHYPPYIPFNFQDPDLEMFIECKSPPNPSPSRNQRIYLVCALTTLALTSFSFFANFSQTQQASQEVQRALYADYLSLINH